MDPPVARFAQASLGGMLGVECGFGETFFLVLDKISEAVILYSEQRTDPMTKNAAKYHTVDCTGEAHSNGHIDHCMMCLNYSWGKIVVPVECATLEDWHNLSDAERDAHKRGRKAFAKKTARLSVEAQVLVCAKEWLAAFNTPGYDAAFAKLESATVALVEHDA